MHILIVVTHLLGAGHLRRSLNLGQAFTAAGHAVTLVSGGVPIPQFSTGGVSVMQLPPVRSDGINFRRLLTPDGAVATQDYLEARQQRLIALLQSQSPDVIITELFPFGRRNLQHEFRNLLQSAMELPRRPIVLTSVRDILSPPSTAAKALETEQLVHNFYDAVLVHSDLHTTPLDLSWPVSAEMSAKLRYTGYVSQPLAETPAGAETPADEECRKEIVVSAGGGSVGGRLFDTVLAAARIPSNVCWRLLVGGSDADTEVARLQASMSTTQAITIEPARRDFRNLLQRAECSISMCGYNTAVDLLQTGTPGVFVPFDDGGETEQRLRATSLSRNAAFRTLLSKDLTPEALHVAVAEVRRAGRFQSDPLRFEGAAESVRITEELVSSGNRSSSNS